ncbi:MAG: hypothetical protein EPO09_21660 [Aquabacterium sp.]|nr:MAG: hypothetical protein EPO09_21660 [Aquabacterium sp.]
MDRRVRADAMWLAENWAEVSGPRTPAGMANPGELRRWLNEAQADTPPAPELTIEAPARLTASIEQVAPQAHRINKLASMAEHPSHWGLQVTSS